MSWVCMCCVEKLVDLKCRCDQKQLFVIPIELTSKWVGFATSLEFHKWGHREHIVKKTFWLDFPFKNLTLITFFAKLLSYPSSWYQRQNPFLMPGSFYRIKQCFIDKNESIYHNHHLKKQNPRWIEQILPGHSSTPVLHDQKNHDDKKKLFCSTKLYMIKKILKYFFKSHPHLFTPIYLSCCKFRF